MNYSNLIKKSLAPNEKIEKAFSLSTTYLNIKLGIGLIKWFLLFTIITFVLLYIQANMDNFSFLQTPTSNNYSFDSSIDVGNFSSGLNLDNVTEQYSDINIILIMILIYVFFVAPLLYFYHKFYLKISNEYIFTDKRVLIKRGWVANKTISIRYNRVTDVKVKQSLIDRFIGVGTLAINTAGSEGYQEKLIHISNPYKLKKALHILKDTNIQNLYKHGMNLDEVED